MKTLVSEKRTQVYFPMAVYRRIEQKAKKESKSSAAIIREAVEGYLKIEVEKEREIDWANDPFIKAAGFIKNDVTDMSVNHDHYIYGSRKAKDVRK